MTWSLASTTPPCKVFSIPTTRLTPSAPLTDSRRFSFKSKPTRWWWWCFDLDLAFNGLSHPLYGGVVDRNMTFGFQIWFLSLQETIKLILWYGVFFLASLMRLTVGVVLVFCIVWLRFLLVFWVGFVGIFWRFYCEFTKGFICCLASIFYLIFLGFLLGFLGDFIRNFQRDLCVLFGLDFCFIFLFIFLFLFFWFLLDLKEISIGGVVDAGDQVMGFAVTKVPLEREF